MKCKHCQYEWEARTDNPKACPRCKNRLDIDRDTQNKESASNRLELSEKGLFKKEVGKDGENSEFDVPNIQQ